MLSKTCRSEKPSAPSYTLVPKNKIGGFNEDLKKVCKIIMDICLYTIYFQTPGPGTYSIPDFSTYKTKLPCVTIASRNNLPADNTMKPGPGTYFPPKVIYFCISTIFLSLINGP